MVQAGVDEEEVGQVQEESLGTIYGGRFGKVDGWQQYPQQMFGRDPCQKQI